MNTIGNLIFSVFISLFFNHNLKESGVANNIVHQEHPINKMLLGKWRSDFDKNEVYIYYEKYCVEYYEKDIIDTMFFKLTKSCDLHDSTREVFLNNAFLIEFNNDTSYFACNLILNLDRNTLSYQNTKTGKRQLFTRIRKKKK